jgi:spoIIIJ-associated protein
VKIRVHTSGNEGSADPQPGNFIGGETAAPGGNQERPARPSEFSKAVFGNPEPKDEFEEKMIAFTTGLIERMGYPGIVLVLFREEKKLGLKIDSEHSSIIIGKKGKNLDALQLLANIYAGRLGHEDMRIILDSENYRIRREESLVRLAYTVADRVRENRGSILLEPMNPFDRRLIHTTLNDIADVETKSEGEGLYKQVRVFFRGAR